MCSHGSLRPVCEQPVSAWAGQGARELSAGRLSAVVINPPRRARSGGQRSYWSSCPGIKNERGAYQQSFCL